MKKRVLNVGGNSKKILLPNQYDGYEQMLLDIDAAQAPDVVCDAREMAARLAPAAYDAVYCSHNNIEHYYPHDVPKVLAGFLHVLKEPGFAQVIVPDIEDVMRTCIARGLALEDTLYESNAGPITVHDVIYGFGSEIERSGSDFFAHKTGFTPRSLEAALLKAGFSKVYIETWEFAVYAMAFKGVPDPATIASFELAGVPA